MDLSELGGEHGGGVTHGVGDGVELAAVVAVGNPDRLAIGKAGGGGESHRRGVSFELRESYHGSERVRQIQEAIHEPTQTSARHQNAGDVTTADAVGGFVPALPIDVARACQGEDLQGGDRNGRAADGEGEVGHQVGHRIGWLN